MATPRNPLPIASAALLVAAAMMPAGCRQTTPIPPGGSFGAFGSATPVPSGQPPAALSIPSLGGTTRVTPPTSASLGTPNALPSAVAPNQYLAPAPIGTFPGRPAAATTPSTTPLGSNQYGSIPMGNALARARAAAMPSTEPRRGALPPTTTTAPIGSGVAQTAFTNDSDLQWRSPTN